MLCPQWKPHSASLRGPRSVWTVRDLILCIALCLSRDYSVVFVVNMQVMKNEHCCGLRRQSRALVKNTMFGARLPGFVPQLHPNTSSVALGKLLTFPMPYSSHLQNGKQGIYFIGPLEDLWGGSLRIVPPVMLFLLLCQPLRLLGG